MDKKEIVSEYNTRLFNSLLPDLAKRAIIDIGCGPAVGTVDLLRDNGSFYVGTDIQYFKDWTGLLRKNIFFVNGDVSNLPFKTEMFDVVILKEVLHHLNKDKQKGVISQVLNLVKYGGKLIIIESNRYNPISFFHMTMLKKHEHFRKADFINLIEKIGKNTILENREIHYWPISNRVFRRIIYRIEDIASRVRLLKPFLSTNMAIIAK